MNPIPPYQNLSPAGHDGIAYRPGCDQLINQLVGDRVQWGVQLPDGEFYILGTRPPEPIKQAHAALDAQGLCKVNGAEVPIVSPHQSVASTRQQVENIPHDGTNQKIYSLVLLAIIAIAIVAVVIIASTRTDKDLQAFLKGDD